MATFNNPSPSEEPDKTPGGDPFRDIGVSEDLRVRYSAAHRLIEGLKEDLEREAFLPSIPEVLHLEDQFRSAFAVLLALGASENSTLEEPIVLLSQAVVEKGRLGQADVTSDITWTLDTDYLIEHFIRIYNEAINSNPPPENADRDAFAIAVREVVEEGEKVLFLPREDSWYGVKEAFSVLKMCPVEDYHYQAARTIFMTSGLVSPDLPVSLDKDSHEEMVRVSKQQQDRQLNDILYNFSLSKAAGLEFHTFTPSRELYKKMKNSEGNLPESPALREAMQLATSGILEALKSSDEVKERLKPVEKIDLAIKFWADRIAHYEGQLQQLQTMRAPSQLTEGARDLVAYASYVQRAIIENAETLEHII